MKFGELTLAPGFGSYTLVDRAANRLPQKLASFLSNLNGSLLGATYIPVWYVGYQLVNGTNHLVICEQVRTTRDQHHALVGVVVNIPPLQSDGTEPEAKLVSIIDSCPLPEEVQHAFDAEMRQLVGMTYTPLVYIGHKLVKGTNHYIYCSATPVYPDATAQLVEVCINVFQGRSMIVSIMPVNTTPLEC